MQVRKAVRLREARVTVWCKGPVEVISYFRNYLIGYGQIGRLGTLAPDVEMGGQHTPGKSRPIVIYTEETRMSGYSIPRGDKS